jgi:hypothetical protein
MRQLKPMENAPRSELIRSTAARRVALAAQASNLFLTHFESRLHLEQPEAWLPTDRPDLAGTAYWARGQRIEPKYAHFRYDMPLGSFHPSHRAKWTTHELCHGLVGFAWRPNQSRFYHHAAARLSEVVPVALWYFFDEVDVNRCELHRTEGLLFGELCGACERLSHVQGTVSTNPALNESGAQFVQREVDAVFRSIESGYMIEHRHLTLNLAKDGAAWASAHCGRLNDPLYNWFRERFLTAEQGAFSSLEDLRERVLAVTKHLAFGEALTPWKAQRSTWIAHDLADRMLTICAQCDGDAQAQLKVLISDLADDQTDTGVEQAIEGYESLFEDYYVPDPDACFGVGYQLPSGYGHHGDTIKEGLETACPQSTRKLGERLKTLVGQFTARRAPVRRGIAREFSDEMNSELSPFERDLLKYESCMAHPKPLDFLTEHFGKTAHSKLRTFLVSLDVDFMQLQYDIHGYLNGVKTLEECAITHPVNLALRPTPDQDMIVVELSEQDFTVLNTSASHDSIISGAQLSKDVLPTLLELGFIRASRQLCVDETVAESYSSGG